MSEICSAVSRIVDFFEKKEMDYMLIGGYALAYYGRIRATLDVDLAVAIEIEEEFELFCEGVREAGFSLDLASYRNPVCMLLDGGSGLEFEVWTRPDGIEWDDETLRRRKRQRFCDFKIWVISPEDFIVNKLSRPDRGVIDEQDVKSVLVRLEDSLDRDYLGRRASNAGVNSVLIMIRDV